MWKKLHLKSQSVVVLSPPAIFNEYLKEIKNTHKVSKSIAGPLDYLVAFVTRQSDLPAITSDIEKYASEDPVIWFAHPKRTSKLAEDLSRDNGFSALGKIGYEVVTGVSIDEDWSAMRFRKVEHIKKMVRLSVGTMTEVGKKRTADNKGPPGYAERVAARKEASAAKAAQKSSTNTAGANNKSTTSVNKVTDAATASANINSAKVPTASRKRKTVEMPEMHVEAVVTARKSKRGQA